MANRHGHPRPGQRNSLSCFLVFERSDGSRRRIHAEIEPDRVTPGLLGAVEHDGRSFEFAFVTDMGTVPEFLYREHR
jgi:hypothetical protein